MPKVSTTHTPRPFPYRKRALHCDAVPLSTLAQAHGTPLYVYSQQHILARLRMFQQAFADVPHTVCFAVKANSSLALLKLLAARAQASTSSRAASSRVSARSPARRSAAPSSRASASSRRSSTPPSKPASCSSTSSPNRELDLLARRAGHMGRGAAFSLRVNPDVFAETHPYISTGLSAHKFGIDINRRARIYRKAAKSKWLQPTGVSVHIGSQIRAVDPFGAALERVANLVQQLAGDGITLTHLDAGGGLGIEYGDADFDPASSRPGLRRAR